MTEVERYRLYQTLPRLSCGAHIRVAQNLVQAYMADARGLCSVSQELQQAYHTAQQRYETLPPDAKALADRLLPWILHLRARHGDTCVDTILALYPQLLQYAQRYGLVHQPN